MHRLHKIIISAVLVIATVLPLAGCGSKAPEADAKVFEDFMEAISSFDYEKAYSMLAKASTVSPAVTAAPEEGDVTSVGAPEDKQEVKKYVTGPEFAEKYQNIFSGLGVKSISWEKLSEEPNGTSLKVKYKAAYTTEELGVIENEYEMTIVLEGTSSRVKWTPALIFPTMDWGYTVRVSTVAAHRGDILASGELLAETVMLNAVVADLEKINDRAEFITRMALILGMDAEDITAKFEKAKQSPVLIAQINDNELTPDMREGLDNLEGARVIENYGWDRYYPKGSLMAHTVGYVGYVEESELEALNEGRTETDGLYTTHSIVGRSGIEKAYESVLRGKDGLSVTVRDAEGEYVSTLYRKPVEHGSDVHLTIDLDLQERAEEVLDWVLWGDDTAGAVVVMNPRTGEVKAIASYPTYDLNKIAISADNEYYSALLEQKNKPLQNRTTLGLYPPGSSIKSFTASAALELGIVNSSYIFTGSIVDDYWTPKGYGTWVWPPIKRTKINNRSEPLNMTNAMLHSDNIYFANLALMMGEDSFLNYLRGIGFEQSMPFELSVAKSTLKVKYDTADQWNLRSIAETGYGQGQVTISPLQLATMYCAFRNNGDIPQARVTKALYRTDGTDYTPYETFESKTWIEGAIQPYTITVLTPMMENIMSREYNGTGSRLRARGCTVAGKTGTAEIGSDKSREISWFVGFRVDVAEEDELLVLVMLEIPTTDEYKYLKFDIARELISMD